LQRKAEDGYFEEITTSTTQRNLTEVLGLLALSVIVLVLLFSCSWISLVFGQEMPTEDTRSLIVVDYSAWEQVDIHPVDFGIIQEVEKDRMDGVDLERIIAPGEEGWFWRTLEIASDDDSGSDIKDTETALFTETMIPTFTALASGTYSPTFTSTPSLSDTPKLTKDATVSVTSSITGTVPSVTTTYTFTPTGTYTRTPTNTRTPTRTRTPTNTGTATNTPAPTNTFPPLPTSTPSNTCPPLTLGNFRRTGKAVKWNLNNTSSQPFTLEALTLTWPMANGDLTRITLGGNLIWLGPDPPPIIFLEPDDWEPINRTVDANSSERLEFTFSGQAATAGYSLTITLSVPCTTSIIN
jgi:hypothetical protein